MLVATASAGALEAVHVGELPPGSRTAAASDCGSGGTNCVRDPMAGLLANLAVAGKGAMLTLHTGSAPAAAAQYLRVDSACVSASERQSGRDAMAAASSNTSLRAGARFPDVHGYLGGAVKGMPVLCKSGAFRARLEQEGFNVTTVCSTRCGVAYHDVDLSIKTGGGHDEVHLMDVRAHRVHVDTGGGHDLVTVRNGPNTTFNIALGGGRDRVNIVYPVKSAVVDLRGGAVALHSAGHALSLDGRSLGPTTDHTANRHGAVEI